MIELGIVQKLEVIRDTEIGLYLNSKEDKSRDDILLPKNQIPRGTQIGDEVEVFVYRDSEDRLIATNKIPKITMGNLAVLKVVDTNHIGAFLDWGLTKDLFLPFKQQVGEISKGKSYLVGIYIDKSDRLCATMKIYDLLSCESPYKENEMVRGIIYSIKEEYGAFVAIDNKYHGLIPNKELYGNYGMGDEVEVRVKKVRADGKLELSLRKQTVYQMEEDAQRIIEQLKLKGGHLGLSDSSTPGLINKELGMSKAAFKRAVGRLMKEGAIEMTEVGIRLTWREEAEKE